MSRLSRTYMVNGEPVEYIDPRAMPVEYVCNCGSSCPQNQCFENLRRRPFESFEGHIGDEGGWD